MKNSLEDVKGTICNISNQAKRLNVNLKMRKETLPLFKALNPEQKALTNKTDKIYLP